MDKRHISLNTRGQTLLEYILLLLITVAIGLGLLIQFNQAVREYTDMLMGDYLTCLLQTGSLPGSQICRSKYQGFTHKQEDLNFESGQQKSSPSYSSNQETNLKQGPIPLSKNNTALSEGASSRTIPVARNKGSSGQSALQNNSFDTNLSGRSKKVALNKKDTQPDDPPSLIRNDSITDSNTNNPAVGRVRYLSTDQQLQTEENALRKNKVEANEEDINPANRNRIAAGNKKLEPSTEMGIFWGEYLKYLLIVGIILTIIFVVGGQLYQIKKGM